MRLTIDERRLIGKAIDREVNKSWVAKVLGVTRNTVYKWDKRRNHLKDRKRKPKKRKVTPAIELFIIAIRNTFHWGTERIRKGLISLPKFMLKTLKTLGVKVIQGIKLSRSTINDVLRKHKLNGYSREYKRWKFFRAKKPDELWQLDPKGPVTIAGRKHWFLTCIDDYSRYLVLTKHFYHCPDVEEMCRILKAKIGKHKPESILTDNSPFKEEWDTWCAEQSIQPLHAHPYYPQDKGKVERAIRNLNEEFIELAKKFPRWLEHDLDHYRMWFNNERYHAGIKGIPCELYT